MALPTRLLFRIARFGGGKALDRLSERMLGANAPAPGAPKPKRSLGAVVTGAVVTRIATGSVPGAIVVGGAMLAKARYDRRHPELAAEAERRDADA